MRAPNHNSSEDDFFVGYLPMPRRTSRFLRVALVGVVALGIVTATLVGARQRDPGTGQWDRSDGQHFAGVLRIDPYPMLQMKGKAALLVGDGKVGVATDALRELDGHHVRVAGHLIEREGRTLVEVESPIESIDARVEAASPIHDRGPVTLVGEIIDPKCSNGAMKPGDGKPHKACASLCLRGGIPPMFMDRSGTCSLIVDEAGHALSRERLEEVIEFVGERVEVRGQVRSIDGQPILQIGPHSFRRRNP